AIMTLDYLKQYLAVMVDDSEIIRGAEQAVLPGRFEEIQGKTTLLLDTAHNPESMKILVNTLENRFENKEIHVLFAAMKDKDIKQMLDILYESPMIK
ncbi:glutamate ligase domain-containing protein, partial [Pseudomonas sp. 2995-3]|uniref:glutamate ligase domain-containing protein n=1 Tax=Pseudomonas sp. 2995-3 TaxID=1712680 RepID=UPI00273A5DAD